MRMMRVIWAVVVTLAAAGFANAAELCWNDDTTVSSYFLSFEVVDQATGEVDTSSPKLTLNVEDVTRDGTVVRWAVPPAVEADWADPRLRWYMHAVYAFDGTIVQGDGTLVPTIQCDPPYQVHRPTRPHDYTCDDKLTITDSLAHAQLMMGMREECVW